MFARNRVTSIDVQAATDGVQRGTLVLVDVRENAERATAHIPGSRHIPLGELSRRMQDLPTDLPVAFICKSGGRSAMAAKTAKRAGLDARNVEGGMDAWQRSQSSSGNS